MSVLPTRMVAKPWGRESLPAPFSAPAGERIGEIWFEPPAGLPDLLVKYIFTSENLSVQVHPSDAQAPGEGKEECWLVIAAEPGAKLGIGFHEPLDAAAMRAAALDGSIEHLLEWHPVKAGDFFMVPAGTVHAIGAGLSLIEVQQNSDTTYRLYDYGRPRELHLDAGIAVAQGERFDPAMHAHVPAAGSITLVEGGYFRLDRIEGPPTRDVRARYVGPLLVIPRLGTALVGGKAVRPGECAFAASIADVIVPEIGQVLLAQPTGA